MAKTDTFLFSIKKIQMMTNVQFFSKGKVTDRNEDCFDHNDDCFVLADGATDKSGRRYDGKTGGELVSRIIAEVCLSTELNGPELVRHINNKVNELYVKLEIDKDIIDAKYRFTSGFICVRLIKNNVTITYLGDLGFRINGKTAYQETFQIDTINSEKRASYIKTTGDINGCQNYILPFILKQFDYQNNPRHTLGYGVIDGTTTPSKFIKVFKYNKKDVKTIELFTDGYYDIPKNATIKAWENLYKKIELEDPDKWIKYKSVKSKDDRTVAIITI
jgi:hypothetical protein